jgi:hypothetical protein
LLGTLYIKTKGMMLRSVGFRDTETMEISDFDACDGQSSIISLNTLELPGLSVQKAWHITAN